MARPNKTLATLRPDLSGSFMEFDLAMNRKGLIAHRVFPVIEVGKQAGVFGKVKIESLLRTMPTVRAPGAAYSRSKWEFTDDNYACVENGHEEVLDDRESEIYAEYLDAELISAERARSIVMTNAEIRVASILQDAATYTPTGITNEWNDVAAATPIADVEGAVERLWAKGIIANALILTRKQFRALRRCDDIIEKVHSQGAGASVEPSKINESNLAQVFDLPYIIVAESLQNTADEGQDASTSSIWSDEYVTVTRIATGRDIQEPCVGRTFHWGEDGSQIGGLIESYREENVRGEVIRCRHDTHEKLLYSEAIEILDNAIDPNL